jgi:hypothetical protein
MKSLRKMFLGNHPINQALVAGVSYPRETFMFQRPGMDMDYAKSARKWAEIIQVLLSYITLITLLICISSSVTERSSKLNSSNNWP